MEVQDEISVIRKWQDAQEKAEFSGYIIFVDYEEEPFVIRRESDDSSKNLRFKSLEGIVDFIEQVNAEIQWELRS